MAARTKPPFRAEHVGSLLRPAALKKARTDWEAGRITQGELGAWEENEIFHVVRQQQEIGLQAVTDGEFRRDSWHMDFYRQIGGLVARGAAPPIKFKTQSAEIDYVVPSLQIEARLSLPKTIFAADFNYLKSIAQAVPKLTIPSPSVLHRRAIAALKCRALFRYRSVLAGSYQGLSRGNLKPLDDRLFLFADRRHQLRDALRSGAARRPQQDRCRWRAYSRDVYPRLQRVGKGTAGWHDGRHSYLPRQPSLRLVRGRRL